MCKTIERIIAIDVLGYTVMYHTRKGDLALNDSVTKCNCKRKQCERHGKCSECIEHHKKFKNKGLPYCERKHLKEKNMDSEKNKKHSFESDQQ